MARKTLKLLESEIKSLEESISEKNRAMYDFRRESDKEKLEITNLKLELETCQSTEGKQREILTTIVKILSGKSQLASKASVIEDLLIIEVDREKENMKRMKNNSYQNNRIIF